MAAWLLTAAMDALMVWALVDGAFMRSMLDSMPVDERAAAEGDFVVTYAAMAGIVAVTLAYATVGLILASRRGSARLGAILLAGGAAFAAVPFGYLVGGLLIIQDPFGALANLVFLVGPASVAFGYTMILPFVALTFPDGRLPSSRWRWPVGLALGALTVATALIILKPGRIADTESRNPLGVEAIPAWLTSLIDPLLSVGIVAMSLMAVAAVVVRYRHGSSLQRQQLRWFVTAVLLAVVPLMLSPLPGTGGPGWVVLAAFGLLLVPVSVWIAVTRYHLYEIDRLISRTIGWARDRRPRRRLRRRRAGAAGLLVGVTQGQTLAVAASTLIAFALFQPVRRRVQRAVDRRFDRARYDGERTAAAFAERLRDQVDLAELETDIAATVRACAPAELDGAVDPGAPAGGSMTTRWTRTLLCLGGVASTLGLILDRRDGPSAGRRRKRSRSGLHRPSSGGRSAR